MVMKLEFIKGREFCGLLNGFSILRTQWPRVNLCWQRIWTP